MINLDFTSSQAVEKLIRENGAFFAFNTDQFLEAANKDIKYKRIPALKLYIPSDNFNKVLDGLMEIC